MKKIAILMLALIAWTASASAQITREQADVIAIDYAKTKGISETFRLYINPDVPNEESFSMTTLQGETIKAKYACWVYFIGFEEMCFQCVLCPCPHHFLFIKEDNGSALEVITNFGLSGAVSPWSWELVDQVGLVEPENTVKQLYPNPVSDWLNLPYNGENLQVTIYDLNGTLLFSEILLGENACQLNVSFLKAGVYLVNIDGETYRIIKK